ncbi:hypothetical protein FRB90_011034 [Tulasnella sp. 427]|nr:hypothetical protein FRB90_011034 [Tulasnella sp. 427]
MLLLWAPYLVPQGPSNLVAVRFRSAVRIDSIQIVPSGVSPFSREPHVVGETIPDSFSVRIFMNTQSSGEAKGPSNSLASATLRFDGGLVDYLVNMGSGVSTRLLIFEGEFERLSVAIYGTPSTEPKLEDNLIQQDLAIPSRRSRLPEAVDPLALSNPLGIAQTLLRRVPDTQPSLITIVQRYMNHRDQDVNMNGNGVHPSGVSASLPNFEEVLQSKNPDEELLLAAATEFGALFEDTEIDNQISTKDEKVILATVALMSAVVWTSDMGYFDTAYQGLLIARLWQMDESVALALYSYPTVVGYIVSSLSRIHSPSQPRIKALVEQLLRSVRSHCPAALAPMNTIGAQFPSQSSQEIADYSTALRFLKDGTTSHSLAFGTVVHLRSAVGVISPTLTNETSDDAIRILQEAQDVLGQPLVFTLLDITTRVCNTLREALTTPGDGEPSSQALQNLFGLATETLHLISLLRSSVPLASRSLRQVAILASNLYIASAETCQRRHNEWEVVETAKDSRDASLSLLEKIYTSATVQKGLSTSSSLFKPVLDGGLHLEDSVIKLPFAAEAVHDLLLDFVKDAIGESDELRLLTDLMEVTPQLGAFLTALEPSKQASLVASLMDLDNGRSGLGEWLIQNEAETIVGHLHQLAELAGAVTKEQTVRASLLRHSVDKYFCYLSLLLETAAKRDVLDYLVGDRQGSSTVEECFRTMLDQDVSSDATFKVALVLSSAELSKDRRSSMSITLSFVLLRSLRVAPNTFTASEVLPTCLGLLQAKNDQDENIFIEANAHISVEIGHALAFLSSSDSTALWGDISEAVKPLQEIIELAIKRHKQGQQLDDPEMMIEQDPAPFSFDGLSEDAFERLAELTGSASTFEPFKSELQWSNYQPHQLNPPISWKEDISTSLKTLEGALNPECSRPVTPPPPSTPPTILGMGELVLGCAA